MDVAFFCVYILMGSLGVQDVCVLRAAMGDSDEVFVWFGDRNGDARWGEG